MGDEMKPIEAFRFGSARSVNAEMDKDERGMLLSIKLDYMHWPLGGLGQCSEIGIELGEDGAICLRDWLNVAIKRMVKVRLEVEAKEARMRAEYADDE